MISAQERWTVAGWVVLGLLLAGLTIAFKLLSPRFGYDTAVRDMPVLWLTGSLVLAGLAFLPLPWLIAKSTALDAGTARALLWLVICAGLAMRLVLFASEPVLEDDYQRYLWDGAMTAHGLNPYWTAPAAAKLADPESPVGALAIRSGLVLGRVNHPDLRTLYPPVAQGAFALAHVLAPFSLTAWRGLIMLFDMAALALLLLLLRDLGRSPLWAALYWWNPVALKELYNSAHMEVLVAAFLLGALVLAVRRRLLSAGASVLFAAGVKIWPLLLLPLIWRPLLARPGKVALAAAMALALTALFAAPLVLAGIDETSGLMAYAQNWRTNSALFPLIEGAVGWVSGQAHAGLLARTGLAAILGTLALWLAATPFADAGDLTGRALLLIGAIFLLTPAQFPWYYLWLLPLLACRPVAGLLLLTATLPLYYSAFYFLPRGHYATFVDTVVWFIWVPAWLMLAVEFAWTKRAAGTTDEAGQTP